MNRLMSEAPNCKGRKSLGGMETILCHGHFYTHELEAATKIRKATVPPAVGQGMIEFPFF